MPLSYHNRHRGKDTIDHVLVAPGGRVEAIVHGPPSGSRATLKTRCVDTGSDGDANPAMVIADVGPAGDDSPVHRVPASTAPAIYREPAQQEIQKLESGSPDFTVTFTEDKNGFYINGQKFSMANGPMLRVKVGSMQHWRIVNATNELHPFHIHQVHFLVYAEDGVPVNTSEWLDTINVAYGNGAVDLIMDFTDPIIKGMSLFHCHLLTHEDKGMMAKILFE
jgi:suppressor of ftsI